MSTNNAQKTPLSRTLPVAIRQRAVSEIKKRWLALPCTVVSVDGGTVTVNFDVPGLSLPQATMPVAASKYDRDPLQPGDYGVARPSSAYIGVASGLGTGSAAPTVLQPNLSALVFEPIGNRTWATVGQDKVMTDATGASVVTLAPAGITLAFDGHSIVINSSGITLTVGGQSIVMSTSGVTIDGKDFLTHGHTATGGTPVLTAPSGGGPVTGDTGPVA